MKHFLLYLLSFVWIYQHKHQPILCANIAEGTHKGALTRKSDAAIATRWSLVKIGTDAAHVAVTGVGDIPKYICADEPAAAEEDVSVQLLGATDETRRGVASGTITAGDFIVPGAAGTVRTLPATTGTYYIIGQAATTVATGEIVEFDSCIPVQRIVA
ncbi:MAG TPA: hypothetical protein VK970_10670 [Candidatus Methylacidiphilales bacterium]|nr:hypothetical protein [Candidatus Methylacidiphilales bacterium]